MNTDLKNDWNIHNSTENFYVVERIWKTLIQNVLWMYSQKISVGFANMSISFHFSIQFFLKTMLLPQCSSSVFLITSNKINGGCTNILDCKILQHCSQRFFHAMYCLWRMVLRWKDLSERERNMSKKSCDFTL